MNEQMNEQTNIRTERRKLYTSRHKLGGGGGGVYNKNDDFYYYLCFQCKPVA